MSKSKRIEKRRMRKRRRNAIGITLLLIFTFTALNILFTDNVKIEGQELKPLGAFEVTSYCSCDVCGGGKTYLTATFKERQADYTVAVDTDVIPLGSRIVFDGKTYVADDTIAATQGKTIAIYKTWHDDVESFATYNAEVFLIKK